jgi:hypothetical protein
LVLRSRGSSVSTVSDYGLDDRAIGVRSPAGTKHFSSSLCVQTGSGAHPASCTVGTGGPFPGDKARPGRDADLSPPSSAEVKNEYELYLLSPPAPPWRVAGQLCFFCSGTYLFGSRKHSSVRSNHHHHHHEWLCSPCKDLGRLTY